VSLVFYHISYNIIVITKIYIIGRNQWVITDEYLMGERKAKKLENNLQNNVNC